MRCKTVIILIPVLLNVFVNGARILATFPFIVKSHSLFYNSLLHELARRGHEVTVITSISSGIKLNNLTEIVFDNGVELPNIFEEKKITKTYTYFHNFFSLVGLICRNSLENPNIQDYIKGEKDVDLIITSSLFNECHLGFAHIYKNAPLIKISPLQGYTYIYEEFGNPLELAQNSNYYFENDHTQEMTINERVLNVFSKFIWDIEHYYFYIPKIQQIVKEHFGPEFPRLSDLETRSSLLLLNTDNAFGNSRAFSPNIIPVAGMHITKPKSLPADLKKWMDEAENGVIYFSLGSAIRGKDIPEEYRKILVKVFGKIKQRVIWKWEDSNMPDKPDNVLIGKWFPQQDLLAHPKIKLFISQGGVSSLYEATYHGIPVLGMPVLGDQYMNMYRLTNKGSALLLLFEGLTESSLMWALNEIINNPSYRENAKHLLKIFKDQPVNPLEKAVYWTEYILRHKGASHLNNPSKYLAWYQRELFDVYLVIFFFIFISIWLTKHSVSYIYKLCVKTKSKKD